jgi:hypothetical protein
LVGKVPIRKFIPEGAPFPRAEDGFFGPDSGKRRDLRFAGVPFAGPLDRPGMAYYN